MDAKIGTDKIFEGKMDSEKMDGRKPDKTQTSKEAPLRPAWGGRSADAVNHLQPKHARAIRWVNAPLAIEEGEGLFRPDCHDTRAPQIVLRGRGLSPGLRPQSSR